MAINYMEVDRMESKKFADAFRGLIEPNQCYDNIANIALSNPHIPKSYPGIQVSYGGIQIFPNNNVYARHIVFLHNKKVIDPTLALADGGIKEGILYLPIETMDYQDYVDFLGKHRETSPLYVLRKMDRVAAELLNKNIFLVG